MSPSSTSLGATAACARRRLRRRRRTAAIMAMRRRTATAAPTPIPIFVPDARPELPSPEFEPFDPFPAPLSLSPLLADVLLPFGPVCDGLPLFPDAFPPCVPLGLPPRVRLAVEAPPVLVAPADGDPVSTGDELLVGSPVGTCPVSNLMLSPVAVGSDANSARTLESLKAVGLNCATSVQLQNTPFCNVLGFPSCEQTPQTAVSSSHRVRAIHG